MILASVDQFDDGPRHKRRINRQPISQADIAPISRDKRAVFESKRRLAGDHPFREIAHSWPFIHLDAFVESLQARAYHTKKRAQDARSRVGEFSIEYALAQSVLWFDHRQMR